MGGFDPLGFTEDYDLYYLQECEIRHARLAMLAVVGWPLSELVAPSWMLQDGRAPSVLNGVNPLSALAILVSFSAFGFFEYKTSIRRTAGTKLGKKHLSDMSNVWNFGVAGDYDFDPANFYSLLGDDAQGRKGLRELEITQGRYANDMQRNAESMKPAIDSATKQFVTIKGKIEELVDKIDLE